MTDWPTKGHRKKVGIHKSNKTLRSSMYKSTSCRELLLRFSFWIYQYSIGLSQWIYYPDLTFLETILLTSFLMFQDKGNKYWAMKKYSLNFYKCFLNLSGKFPNKTDYSKGKNPANLPYFFKKRNYSKTWNNNSILNKTDSIALPILLCTWEESLWDNHQSSLKDKHSNLHKKQFL